jgi:hypothetical protein
MIKPKETVITYLPRNDLVLVKVVNLGEVRGVAMPDIAMQGKVYIVEAVGPKVEGLKQGDEVLIGGKANEDWAFLPSSKDLFITRQENVLLVVREEIQGEPEDQELGATIP